MTSNMKRRPSMKDVAELANTSKATVSRVLSGKGYVSATLREKVRRVARETGFAVDGAARALARRKGGGDGLFHGSLTIVDHGVHSLGREPNQLFSECDGGVLEAADAAEMSVSLFLVPPEDYAKTEPPPRARSLSTDGFLVHSGKEIDPKSLQSLAPTVMYPSRTLNENCCPVVEPDDAMGIRFLVEHLSKLGHRRLAFVCSHSASKPCHPPFHERRMAFLGATRERGLRGTVVEVELDDFGAFAERFVGVSASDRPTAFVCVNDADAFHLINHLAARGLRVPRDVSVTGFDGQALAEDAVPSITTWRPDWRRVGIVALHCLLSMVRGAAVAERHLVGGDLLARGSTGPSSADA